MPRVGLCSHRPNAHATRLKVFLGFPNGVLAKVKNRSRQDRAGTAVRESGIEMFECAYAA